ncbi:MAG: GNAT family N-acetyltransferase, partial [Planctomycetales bacterium]|nr:GNAT family N-acetyltransferase [Planctomycetales bacterium]
MRACLLDPTSDGAWPPVASRGHLFLDPRWLGAIAETYGFGPLAALTEDGRSGLAAFLVEDPGGRRLVSLPFSDHGDPVLGDPGDLPVLVAALRDAAPGARLVANFLSAPPLVGVPESEHDLHHATSLAGGVPRWNRRRRRERAALAKRGGLVRDGGPEELRAFHALHARFRKEKYGVLTPPLAFFEAVFRRFAEAGDALLAVAELRDHVIAAGLFLVSGGVLYDKYLARAPGSGGTSVVSPLLWRAADWGVAKGCRLWDHGLTPRDNPGLREWKLRLGSEEREIRHYAEPLPP